MAEQQEVAGEIAQAETLVKMKMTKEAVERYSTLKSAHPQKAIHLLAILAQLIQENKIGVIDDVQLKALLTNLSAPKREFKITRR